MQRLLLCKWSKPNQQGRVYSYYRCKDNYRRRDDLGRCNARPIPCAILDDLVHEVLLDEVGDAELERVDVVPGDGHESELAAVGLQIADLATERYVKKVMRPGYEAIKAALEAEYARLDDLDLEKKPDEVKRTLTGQTFAAKWAGMTGSARRLWLRDNGVRVAADRWPEGMDGILPASAADPYGATVTAFGCGLRIIVRLGDLDYLRDVARQAA